MPLFTPEVRRLGSVQDAVEVIGEAFERQADTVMVPVEYLVEDFFRLRTRLAGEMIQKFVTYRRRLAIAGDVSRYMSESSAFRDFVTEANRGDQVWFVENREELEQRLGDLG